MNFFSVFFSGKSKIFSQVFEKILKGTIFFQLRQKRVSFREKSPLFKKPYIFVEKTSIFVVKK